MFLSVMQNKSWEKTVALTRIFRGKKEKNKKKHVFYFLALSWVTCHVK